MLTDNKNSTSLFLNDFHRILNNQCKGKKELGRDVLISSIVELYRDLEHPLCSISYKEKAPTYLVELSDIVEYMDDDLCTVEEFRIKVRSITDTLVKRLDNECSMS